MNVDTLLLVQIIIWIITTIILIILVYWTHKTRKRRQFWNITIPQIFYLANQFLFYTSILVAEYYDVTLSELFRITLPLPQHPSMGELWSSLLRLQGTITMLAVTFIVKSYLKRIPYDSIYLR